VKPVSPWPSLRRFWRTELSGQYDRPELEASSGTREGAGSGAGQLPRHELSAEQGSSERSAVAQGPVDPHDFPRDSPAPELVGEPDAQSGYDRSNSP
jgi:hypothetical protein